MKTQSAKAKGRNLQKHVKKVIEEVFTELEEGDVESRPMGSGGTDLLMSPKARERCPISFECKNTTRNPSSMDLEQSKRNMYEDTLPVVAWKPRGKSFDDTLVICKLDELLKLLDTIIPKQSKSEWRFE